MIDGFDYNDSAEVQARVMPILRKLTPHSVDGFRKIRLGGNNDGAYITLDDFEGITRAYSLGINDDVKWDLEIAARGIHLYQYDHTIESPPFVHEMFHWERVGIEGVASDAPDLDTLENLMRRNGHWMTGDMILKCDIEGHEWEMLANASPDCLLQFRQIILEMHAFQELHRTDFCALVKRAFDNLTAAHRVIHVHGNNNTAYSVVGGIALPAALEFTFVRKTDRTLRYSNEIFPTHLDMPCWPHRADYALGTFTF